MIVHLGTLSLYLKTARRIFHDCRCLLTCWKKFLACLHSLPYHIVCTLHPGAHVQTLIAKRMKEVARQEGLDVDLNAAEMLR